MGTLYPNPNEYYESEVEEVEFSCPESYIDRSQPDHGEEPEAHRVAEREAALGVEGIEIEDNARDDKGVTQESIHRLQRSREKELSVLPSIPQFHPFIHNSAMHTRQTCYPFRFDPANSRALCFFEHFFDDIVFKQLAETTNSYPIFKGTSSLRYQR
ncbi:hypothetical protein B9Z19DRAFT_1068376 [Tuber borchii]|uniref:PiggyBac transposable element-derived protein domain-containing protein n=1 Tax=Tuber borchii TaxID=42251 RepID=A0A2T6ZFF4_TUBBO|nr:hypothetical protein B9Z19DRAFT_1068376 [Tuber borchii]